MNFPVTLFHNPNCGTSRTVLAHIQDAGIEPEIVLYLKTPPSREELAVLLEQGGMHARDLLREKEALAEELGLRAGSVGDDTILDAMAKHPVLINRPVVISPKGVRLCRPADLVFDLLP